MNENFSIMRFLVHDYNWVYVILFLIGVRVKIEK